MQTIFLVILSLEGSIAGNPKELRFDRYLFGMTLLMNLAMVSYN